MRPILLALALLWRFAVPVLAVDAAPEVTPVEPAVEQRVEAVAGGPEQQVRVLGADEIQQVAGSPEKGPGRRFAETAGKVVLGVAALGVSLGFTVASLLFF